jgi:hypothetical protein
MLLTQLIGLFFTVIQLKSITNYTLIFVHFNSSLFFFIGSVKE